MLEHLIRDEQASTLEIVTWWKYSYKSSFPDVVYSNTVIHHFNHSYELLIVFVYKPIVEVTNRFKGLDLINRAPEELWTEVCDIVQEAVMRTIPKKKKCKKAKWLSEEALQIAEKRKEARGKGEKERHNHLNAEFQRKQGEIRKLFSVINTEK